MKLMFNLPPAHLQGGPVTHLPLLKRLLEQHLQVVDFHYGAYEEGESLLRKILGRSQNLLQARSLLVQHKPDLIHCNSAFDKRALLRDVPLALLAARRKTPLFVKFHGSVPEAFDRHDPLASWLRKQLFKKASAFGVLSRLEREEFEGQFPQLAGRVHVVKNIIKPEFFSVSRAESPVPTVLFISRFVRRKGVFDLLKAVPEVLKAEPATQFVLAGDGPAAAEFDQLVVQNRLSGSVKRLPHVDHEQARGLYAKAWVLAFPTLFPEGMPMVIAEAMACGVPCVTTRTRFSLSYMQPGVHCQFADQASPASLAKGILFYLDSAQARVACSQANRDLAQGFDAQSVAAEYLRLYERLLA